MNDLSWLMYASAAVWLGLGAYLFCLNKKMARLETRLIRFEQAAHKTTALTSTALAVPHSGTGQPEKTTKNADE